MNRTTIDYGIDLGTTNSSIALLDGLDVTIFKNNENAEYTPSAVWIDKNNQIVVGHEAKKRLESDSENAQCEFKLRMGKGTDFLFKRSGRRMTPEELSAEILKSLRATAHQRNGEDVHAAVITVPAAFDLPANGATRRAAQMAGIEVSPLLQEPVAAGLAYGFKSDSDKVFWLVYDLGGGTFDAAILQMRDGVIQIVNHGGDPLLGGKNLDWEIVHHLLIPAVVKEHGLPDFQRGNPRWNTAIAKLKYEAEVAKILLSESERRSVGITIDFLCQGTDGEPVTFDYQLERKDVERLAEPLIARSIIISRQVLAEQRLSPQHIDKLLLVGGPTMMPYLRERLLDPKEGLGIPLEFKHDALTVVARGAAIFAGTQRLEGVVARPKKSGTYTVALEYEPMGASEEPVVGGRVLAAGDEDLSGFTIEFINPDSMPPWRTGRIGLAPDGVFLTTVFAEPLRVNTFRIELCNAVGSVVPTTPDSFPYTIGIGVGQAPLTHSIGVELFGNTMEWFFEKGTALPARQCIALRTAMDLHKGQSGCVLRIPVREGGRSRADRNSLIGTLEIGAERITRDVPILSDVEVTLEVDASRLVRAKAYIPILDEEFEVTLSHDNYRSTTRENLRKEADAQKARLAKARESVQKVSAPRATELIREIDAQRIPQEIEQNYAASAGDEHAADRCDQLLRELRALLDDIEDALDWPALVENARKEVEVERGIVNDPHYKATPEEKEAFAALEEEIQRAMRGNDADVLRRKVNEMDGLGLRIVMRGEAYWVARFEKLEEWKGDMRDARLAESYLQQGRRARHEGNLPGLQAAVRQLEGLLRDDSAHKGSGVIK
jgi:molecular chaperone DnaK